MCGAAGANRSLRRSWSELSPQLAGFRPVRGREGRAPPLVALERRSRAAEEGRSVVGRSDVATYCQCRGKHSGTGGLGGLLSVRARFCLDHANSPNRESPWPSNGWKPPV